MAPLPPESPERWWLDYSTCGESHSLQMRCEDGATATDASTAFDNFLTSIDSQVYELTVDGLRRAANGSNISLPAVWSGEPTYGSGDGPHDHSAAYVDFIGRSIGGRRVRAAVFGGINFSVGADFRVSAGESTVVEDALAALVAAEGFWIAIDGLQPVWHSYFNIGPNAYWRNKIR